jgi:signal transduction histidine kinase
MNSIIGFSGLLEDDDYETDEKKVFVKRIINNGQLLLGLINDIIDISKIEANQVSFHYIPINILELFEGLKATFCLQVDEKSIALKFHIPDEISTIHFYSDIIRLKQIMLNLITNAIKFTNENGQIDFGCTLSKGYLQFFVKDTGIGIDKKEHEQMFSRFRQSDMVTNSSYGGTGLGLSISKGLIEKMGGKIWLKSELNKGSTFYFTLPIRN